MQHFLTTIKDNRKPWLVIGKGPSVEKLTPALVDSYENILTINHAVKLAPCCTVALMIDIDPLNDSKLESFFKSSDYIALPFEPHVEQKPDGASLYEWIDLLPLLFDMDQQGRLLYFNFETASSTLQPAGLKDSLIKAGFFTSEAAFHLLALAGVKEIHTIGIDGGQARSKLFTDTGVNPHGNYDAQFQNLDKLVTQYGINWRKL